MSVLDTTTTLQSKPDVDSEHKTTAVEWFQPTIKQLNPDVARFFKDYVGLKDTEEILSHIYDIRSQAWQILPYPCIGLFRFLDFSIHLSPEYPMVVERVRNGATFLDLGCCFGQDLRKLAFDSGCSRNLLGSDIEASFMQLGFDLFSDREHFQGTMIPGDVSSPDFLSDYHGKVDIVYLGSFLHLFNEAQQRVVIDRLNLLLSPMPGSMVFGRHLGAEVGGPFRMESIGWDLYRHSHETLENLFQQGSHAPEGAQWKVTSSLSRYESANWDESRRGWQGSDTKQMMFSAIRS